MLFADGFKHAVPSARLQVSILVQPYIPAESFQQLIGGHFTGHITNTNVGHQVRSMDAGE